MTTRSRNLLPGWSPPLLLLAWSVPVVLGLPYTIASLSAGVPHLPLWRTLAVAIACWQVWTPLSLAVVRITDRWPIERPWRVRVLLLHAGLAVAACAVQAATTAVTATLLELGGARLRDVFAYWFMILTPAGVIVYAAVVAVRMAQRRGAEARQRDDDARELARALTEAQLLTLRSQLRPHFLFNTLNAVLALVGDGETARAREAITSLATLLRSTLHSDARHEVSLEEELRFVEEYLHLERLRHGDRLGVRLEVPPALRQATVPSLVLQPLVENALKHGVGRARGPVELVIAAHRQAAQLHLTVADTGAGVSSPPAGSTGVGLRNLRARLEQLYPGEGQVTLRDQPNGRGAIAEVVLPARGIAA